MPSKLVGTSSRNYNCDRWQQWSALQAQQRKELTEFASLELSATTESERVLAASLSDLATQLTGHAAALSSTEAELRSTQAALAHAEEEVSVLKGLSQVTEHVTPVTTQPRQAGRAIVSACKFYVRSERSHVRTGNATEVHAHFVCKGGREGAEGAEDPAGDMPAAHTRQDAEHLQCPQGRE